VRLPWFEPLAALMMMKLCKFAAYGFTNEKNKIVTGNSLI